MEKRNRITNGILTFVFAILSLVWVYPVVMVVLNAFKVERAISTNTVFKLPTADTFAGLANFADALSSKGFLSAFWYSLVITVTSVVLILVCCSMCAWFITRVNTWVSKLCYFLFVFSMVVPFQMLMFTLSALSDKLGLNTPYNICIIYLGFGAGLAVVMPAWMEYVCGHDVMRFARFAVNVFGCEMDFAHPERTVQAGIRRLRDFFRTLGMPATLEEVGGRAEDIPAMVAHRCEKPNGFPFGGFVKIQEVDMEAVLRRCAN